MSSRHFSYAQHVLSDRDKIWSDRMKSKSKYDELCHEVEVTRNKKEKAESHDKHKDRAIKDWEAREEDMSNQKNLYLISIASSNKSKNHFYQVDLPSIQDHFQSLLTLSNNRLFTSLLKCFNLFQSHHQLVNETFQGLISSCTTNFKPQEVDQKEFIEANRKKWEEPQDWTFEPCVGFFDNSDPLISDSSKVFLQNKLLRARKKLRELKPLVETKGREIAGLENLRDAYERQEGLGDGDEVMENLLDCSRQILSHQTAIALLETEVQSIIEAIGDDEGEARPHKFKPASFTIPTTCNFCEGTIWGIARQGFVCKPCGYTVHSKCEMKVPADCRSAPPQPSGSASASASSSGSTLARSSSIASTATGANSSLARSVSENTSTTRMSENPKGKMAYAFDATSPFELSVKEGDIIELVEDDSDDCGWIKVRSGTRLGLVPTSYCDFGDLSIATTETDGDGSVAMQGCGKYVQALYDYTAADSEELSLVEGEEIELTSTGYDYGEGWVEAIKGGRIGIVPSNHIQAL